MATFKIGPDPRFHVGDTILCFAATAVGLVSNPAAVTSSTVAADSTTRFTDLNESTNYAAGKTIAGPFVSFKTATPGGGDSGGGLGANTMGVVLWDAETEEYPDRPAGASAIMWLGPEAPAVGGTGALEGADVWIPTIDQE